MNFLPDVYVECEECKGKRYNAETLKVLYKGKSISDVLNMSVEEALKVFEAVPSIERKLATLVEVGLGYIKVGQSATTLSGGEAQRIKLTRELAKRGTGKTLYLLDEPTTGLHFADIHKLLEVLHSLVEKGNTILVIEHNLDVIKAADHLIDLGPEGGEGGGQIVASGTPEEVAKNPASYTGKFLAPLLKK
jgi:excinuclease ABC subunit A